MGTSRFVLQCQACGKQVGRGIPYDRVKDPRAVKPWDTKLAAKPMPNKKRRDYSARFKRADWKRLRALVLERDHFSCRSCGEPATDVHHLTYDRFGEERLSDLAASCRDCNLRERESRHL
jgi:hypothetical protein